MARLDILTQTAQREFERPPSLNHEQRRIFFALTPSLRTYVRGLDSTINRVGFLLQLGYFRACGRFFSHRTFVAADVIHVARLLAVDPGQLSLYSYNRKTIFRHRQIIRQDIGFIAFAGSGRVLARQEVTQLVSRQIHPEQIFWTLCQFLRTHRVEVPPYFTLCQLISQAISQFETELDERLTKHLTADQVSLLDDLLVKLPDDASGRSIHQLARLKNAQELMRLSVIRSNMDILKDLKARYASLRPVIQALDLSAEMIEYYAEYVLRADVFQIKRRVRRQLILLCFVQYQYFHVSDILLQTFTQATEISLLQAEDGRDTLILARQAEDVATIEDVLSRYLTHANVVRELQNMAFSLTKTRDERFAEWMSLMNGPEWDAFLTLESSVKELHGQARKQINGAFWHQSLGEQTRPLMNRIADLLRHIEFAGQHPDNAVMRALAFYQQKGGQLSNLARPQDLPLDFLPRAERGAVRAESSSAAGMNLNLYRILLARAVVNELKAGRITVRTSHTYKAFEDYLIDETTWQEQKGTLLERAGLRHLEH